MSDNLTEGDRKARLEAMRREWKAGHCSSTAAEFLFAELERVEAERDATSKFLGRFGEELVNAGFCAGDRDVQLGNLRSLIQQDQEATRERDEARARAVMLLNLLQKALSAWAWHGPKCDAAAGRCECGLDEVRAALATMGAKP